MYIYSRKQKWKLMLFFAAVIIGVASWWYTNILVNKLSAEERKKVELWAEAIQEMNRVDFNQDISLIGKILENNTTVPVILADSTDQIISVVNLDSARARNPDFLERQLHLMKSEHDPIVIELIDGSKNYVYYKDSTLLTQLHFYPLIQLGVIFLFILVSYLAFSTSRKAEQNQVWVGMSKETAHQLGTPISSLLAWIEMMKLKENDKALMQEVEKDVRRLEKITERFSKIGASPVLTQTNVIEVIVNAVNYIKTRSSSKLSYHLHFSSDEEIFVPLNIELFEWVIENLCKNAIDAMNGSGRIDIRLTDHVQVLYVDVQDSGKGISKSQYKTIFQPGYTSKKRGWGLGLSLARRIVEEYHSGKIFVKASEINKGTTFRIALKK